MRFDMHCHTKEGSPDARVPIGEYISILEDMGFDGMLVTDHDSYKGYRYWARHIAGEEHENFVVLRGIEYDTIDAGHIIVIMPDDENVRVLEFRGLPVQTLIDIVHSHGGILGPAHPYGEKYLSFVNTHMRNRQFKVIEQFDFIETYNACEAEDINENAKKLAHEHGKKGFGGSDAHKPDCCGLGYTDIDADIRCQNDLIAAVRSETVNITSGGTRYGKTTKDKLGKANRLLVEGFKYYNSFMGFIKAHKRKSELRREEEIEKIKRLIEKGKKNDKG